jgi:hypothetical protein
MGISFGSASWTLSLSRKNREHDQKVAEYLDQIAEEALALTRIWENVAVHIMDTGVANAETDIIWIRLVERPEWTIYSKSIPKSRLELFYEKLSSVVGKGQKGETDFLICRIGAILQKRTLTKDIIEEELKRMKEARFFDKQNQVKDEITLAASVSILKAEALALSAIAKEYKTKI